MSGCEAGVIVILFSVFGFGIMSWVDLWRVGKRLDRIEKSLMSMSEKHSDNNDNVCSSKEKEEYTSK